MSLKNYIITLVLFFLIVLAGGYFFFFYNFPADNSSSYRPQQTQLYLIDESKNDLLNILVSTLPEFAVKLADEKFKNLWQVQAAERKELIEAKVINAKRKEAFSMKTQYDEKNKQVTFTPLTENTVKPGMYRLSVRIKTYTGEFQTITQDFTWGVMAINTTKGIYQVGDGVEIGMAVLDAFGKTKCMMREDNIMVANTARVWLTVTSPSGSTEELSTENKGIIGSKMCVDRSVTNKPDFLAKTKALEKGTYKLHMVAETLHGKQSIDDSFKVSDQEQPFEIQRTDFPTRIYPRAYYPVIAHVKTHKDYSGKVIDTVPGSFKISEISDNGVVKEHGDYQTIEWNVDWRESEEHVLQYTIKFPLIVPEFYLLGPLKVGSYNEGRNWQIVSDSLFSLVQEVHVIATTGNTIGTSFAAGVTLNNLIIGNCMKQATTNSWPTGTGGWTRAIRNTSGTRGAQYYRVVNGTTTPAGTTAFNCPSTTSNTTEIAAEFMEFSGTSTSSLVDSAVASIRTGRTCNTNNTTNNIYTTPSSNNPDDLIVSISIANSNALTVTSHTTLTGTGSQGMTDADLTDTTPFSSGDGFYRSSGTGSYDGAWGEAVSTPQIQRTETTKWSGSGTCVIGAVAYNAAITTSQGSYRFFAQEATLNPTTPLAAANTAITLNAPGQKFRLRILLDVDSVAGNIAIDAGDWTLGYAIRPTSNNCADLSATDYAQVTNPVTLNSPSIAFYDEPTLALAANISATGNDPSDAVTYTTVLENFFDDDNNAGTPPDIYNHQNAIANGQAGLFDISLVDNTDDSSSQTYCLAMLDAGGNFLDVYRNFPTVTTIVNDVVIRGGSTILGGTTLR